MVDEHLQIQDNARENQLTELFELIPTGERLGADAHDENGNPFELKSTTVKGIGTGRDVSLQMINDWLKRYWIVAKGANARSGFRFDEIYFLSPAMMEGGFAKIRNKIVNDLTLTERTIELVTGKLTILEIQRVQYLMERGSTLNNPKIPWNYIQQHGIRITDNYAPRLRELVKTHPL